MSHGLHSRWLSFAVLVLIFSFYSKTLKLLCGECYSEIKVTVGPKNVNKPTPTVTGCLSPNHCPSLVEPRGHHSSYTCLLDYSPMRIADLDSLLLSHLTNHKAGFYAYKHWDADWPSKIHLPFVSQSMSVDHLSGNSPPGKDNPFWLSG